MPIESPLKRRTTLALRGVFTASKAAQHLSLSHHDPIHILFLEYRIFLKFDNRIIRKMGHHSSRSTALSAGRVQTVYFAFGSNLHLAQMAKRCPESRYLGRGMLRNHKWQISTRGFANIYFQAGEFVEGLCFLLSQKDEERLDRNEGVHLVPSSYEKETMDVEVYPTNPSISGRRVKEVDEYIHRPGFTALDGSKAGEMMKALVYINHQEKDPGEPRTEYVNRIRAGVADAKLLGIPRLYFDQNFTRIMGWGDSPETRGTGSRRQVAEGPPDRRDLGRDEERHVPRNHNPDGEHSLYIGVSSFEGYNVVDGTHPSEEVRTHEGTHSEVMAADAMHHSQTDVDLDPHAYPRAGKGDFDPDHVPQATAEQTRAEAGQEVMNRDLNEHTTIFASTNVEENLGFSGS